MRKLLVIISSAFIILFALDACKRGPGDCGDGKQNGNETTLDCGPSCKLCPAPIAPEGNYIIGRIKDKFFTEQRDSNLTNSNFRIGNDEYELYTTAGFYKTALKDKKLVIEDTNIIIGIAQTFKYDTAIIPTAADFIAKLDTGYQRLGSLTLKNEINKTGFFIIYKNNAAVEDSNIVYSTYYGPFNQPGAQINIKKIKRLSNGLHNIIGEFQGTVYDITGSKKIYIDKGRFNLNYKIQ